MFRPTTCGTMINREFVTPPKEFRRRQDAEDYLGKLQIYSNLIGATENRQHLYTVKKLLGRRGR